MKEYWKKHVKEFIKELKTAKYWFKNDGNPKPEWKLFEIRDAARYADLDTAWNAARYAAKDTHSEFWLKKRKTRKRIL